jgi:hypothetical protein
MRSARIVSTRSAPEAIISAVAQTSVAPAEKASQISSKAASNAVEKLWCVK